MTPDSYDEVPYPSLPRTQSHPAHIAAIAALAGVRTPSVERWRVLEIGCGDAASLLPLAADWPDARLVGVDRARQPIERGRALARAAGLDNLELHVADLLDWEAEGEFDYIVAHGVFSWTPPAVRERILALCSSALAPAGVAYISYNALPGAHLRRFAWDLLRFHSRAAPSPAARIEETRELARLIRDHEWEGEASAALRAEMKSVLERSPLALYHDDLAKINDPLYLLDFVAQAGRAGLQYLGDAQPQRDDVRACPVRADDWLEARQYGDYFAARRFRETLLCRGGVAIDRRPSLDRLRELYAASRARPLEPQADGQQKFELPHAAAVTTNHAPARRLLRRLAELWPQSARLADLLPGDADATLAEIVTRLFEAEAIELRTSPPRLAGEISETPAVSRLVRAQVAAGGQMVTSQRHQSIHLEDGPGRTLVSLLDGRRRRAELLAQVAPEGGEEASRRLEAALQGLYRLSLLVG
jgi:SAM-dependent methyltransferase